MLRLTLEPDRISVKFDHDHRIYSAAFGCIQLIRTLCPAQLRLHEGSVSSRNTRFMKVKAINRSDVDYKRDRVSDLHKVHKNLDPSLHPFEKAVEYTRSLNAAKLDRCAAPDRLINCSMVEGRTIPEAWRYSRRKASHF